VKTLVNVIKDEEVFVSTRLMEVYHDVARAKSGRYSFKDFLGEHYQKIIDNYKKKKK
jgi:hypothetical protein